MHFSLNQEQRQLRESARRFFTERHPVAQARRALPWPDELQQALWRDMAHMGWLGMLAPEALGGMALGVQEACLVADAAGRQLFNMPYAASSVLLPLLARHSDSPQPWLEKLVASIAAGDVSVNVSPARDAPREYANQCALQLAMNGDAVNGSLALGIVESASDIAAAALDPTLTLAPAGAAGVAQWHRLDISPGSASRCMGAWQLVRAAEAMGAAAAALDMACDYARQREQFGKPIGSHQAVKHKLADAWMRWDDAQLAVLYAAAAMDTGAPDWRYAGAAAQLLCIEGALQITRDVIQIHGALGFTWEHDAHLYMKRVHHIAAMTGGRNACLEIVAKAHGARGTVSSSLAQPA